MATKIYGASDDLVEFEGTIHGEVGCYGTDDDDDLGVLVAFDDGTVLTWRYGKGGLGIWGCTVLSKGSAFISHTDCHDEDAAVYSDIVVLGPGATKAWAGTNAQKVS
jgi:hypothetical protein